MARKSLQKHSEGTCAAFRIKLHSIKGCSVEDTLDDLNFPLSEEGLAPALRLRLGSGPASEHEGDLVLGVGPGVDNVEESFSTDPLRRASAQIPPGSQIVAGG